MREFCSQSTGIWKFYRPPKERFFINRVGEWLAVTTDQNYSVLDNRLHVGINV
jgi:hypothetical protein